MKTIIIVRHGATAWNAEGRIMGQTDIPLSPQGRLETETLRGKLGLRAVGRIYSSTSNRALESALILSQGQIPILELDALKERVQGILEGLTRSEIEARYYETWNPFINKDPWFSKIEGRETLYAVLTRVMNALELIMNDPAERILIVTHGTPARLIQFLLAPRPAGYDPFALETPHGSFLEFRDPKLYPYTLLE